jgi:hypothetical protein
MLCSSVEALVDRTAELLNCSVVARSITYAGIKAIVELMAPSDESQPFTSKDLQRIFTGVVSFDGKTERFHPMQRYAKYYSMRPPDFAITYVWGTDLRKEFPLYIQSVEKYVRSGEFVHEGDKLRFDEMTFWIDILFVDQSPSGDASVLIAKLVEDCSRIYARTPHHLVFMSDKTLDRGWCLMEICYRAFAVQVEFTLSVFDLLRLLSGSGSGLRTVYSSTVTLKDGITETFIRRNKLPSLHFIKDIGSVISLYGLVDKNILQDMHVFEGKEKTLIAKIVTILFRDEATFNRVIHAFARGAVSQLDKLYPAEKN